MFVYKTCFSVAFIVCGLVSMFAAKASGDLIYYFVEQELVAEDGSGEVQSITGGELVLVDGADDDGILQSNEVISAFVNTSSGGPFTADVNEGSLSAFGTFSNGQLIGGSVFLNEDDLNLTYVDWGGGDKISFAYEGDFFSKDISPGNFVIATRAVPEPSSAMVVLGGLMFGLCGRRKKCSRK